MIFKVSQLKSAKLRFIFVRIKGVMVSTDPSSGLTAVMYLEVFLNINAEIHVERGTLLFHTVIPMKY